MVEKIKAQHPDLLLITGDFLDEGVTNSLISEMKPFFDSLQPRYGKIAVLGNHEYINDIHHTAPLFKKLGITLLRDSSINVDNHFELVGRDDYSSKRMTGVDRKSLAELMKPVDKTMPVFLLDHQPYKLDETARFAVDLQLSGHTHDGQLFPFNLITRAMYEISCGYKQKGSTHFYVSSGYGTWGPRIRLGNKPELVVIDVDFR
jgi:predicted MPP superfamily phosphohydrolase